MPTEETKKIKVQSRGGKNICKPIKKIEIAAGGKQWWSQLLHIEWKAHNEVGWG